MDDKLFINDSKVKNAVDTASLLIKNDHYVNLHGNIGSGKQFIAKTLSLELFKIAATIVDCCKNPDHLDFLFNNSSEDPIILINIHRLNSNYQKLLADMIKAQKEYFFILTNENGTDEIITELKDLILKNRVDIPAWETRTDKYEIFCYYIEQYSKKRAFFSTKIDPQIQDFLIYHYNWKGMPFDTIKDIAGMAQLPALLQDSDVIKLKYIPLLNNSIPARLKKCL